MSAPADLPEALRQRLASSHREAVDQLHLALTFIADGAPHSAARCAERAVTALVENCRAYVEAMDLQFSGALRAEGRS